MHTDPGLPHQVILRNTNGNTGHPTLTCNCRVRAGQPDLGHSSGLDETVEMYNDPNNHCERFTDADRLTPTRGSGPHGLGSQSV